jgi:hypothetical protein
MQSRHRVIALCKRLTSGLRRLNESAARNRSAFTRYAIRGAAYKAGTVAVGLLAVWFQNRH